MEHIFSTSLDNDLTEGDREDSPVAMVTGNINYSILSVFPKRQDRPQQSGQQNAQLHALAGSDG